MSATSWRRICDSGRGAAGLSAIGGRLRCTAIAALSVGVWFSGCGGGVPDAGPRARGVVTVDGKPVTAGNIFFVPKEQGSSAFAIFGPDGRFDVQTSANQNGIKAGEYSVYFYIEANEEGIPVENDGGALMPRKYTNAARPLLDAVITEEGPNEFEFHLKSDA